MDHTAFEWSRPRAGHRWADGSDIDSPLGASNATERYLVEVASPDRWVYQPFALPYLLCARFAQLEPTPARVLEFADEYGRLGTYVTVRVNSAPVSGERFETWSEGIVRMRRAMEVWSAVQSADAELLQSLFVATYDQVYFESHPHLLTRKRRPRGARIDWLAIRETQPELHEALLAGHPFSSARLWLQREVNRGLGDGVRVRVLQRAQGFSAPGLFITPGSLIAGLWLQLAQMITLNHELRSCQQCGSWFEIRPEVARTSKKYCQDACKSRAFRGRRRARGE